MIESWCFGLNSSQNGYTALIWAVNRGQRAVVGLLLGRGADTEAKESVSRALLTSPKLPWRIARLGRAQRHSPDPQPRGVAQWRPRCSGAVRIGMEGELWSMCGRWVG